MNTTTNGRVSRPNYSYALLFQCLGGRIRKILIRNQNANSRPGQLQVVDLAPELLGFRHYHDFPRHFRHDLAKAIEFVKSGDRKSTRLNSSHVAISYAVFCLKKKNDTSNGRDTSRVEVQRVSMT